MSEYIDAAARSYAKRLPGAPLVVNSNMKNARGASAGGSAEVRKITTAEEVAELKKTGGFIKFFAPVSGDESTMHCVGETDNVSTFFFPKWCGQYVTVSIRA
jgi:hypothetical protein